MTKLLRSALFVLDGLTQIALYAAVSALAAMVGIQIFEIIARYFFSAPTSWASDSVGYLLLVSVVLSMPAVTSEKGHVAIDILLERLTPGRRRIAMRALAVVGGIMCFVAAGAAFVEAYKQWHWGVKTVATFALPKWGLTATIALGLLLSAGHFLVHARSGDELGTKGQV